MELFLKNHDYKYAAEQMMLMLFPEERPLYPEAPSGADRAEISLTRGAKRLCSFCVLHRGGLRFTGRADIPVSLLSDDITTDSLCQRAVRLSFYRAGIKCLGKKPVWGALTGIRPGKLMSKLLESGMSDKKALGQFISLYDADPDRARLCLHTAHAGLKTEASLEARDVCLYLGVPFCPTRCAYCSFVSQAVKQNMKLISPFVDALLLDIEATANAVKSAGARVISVYFGGGTPTTLSALQLEAVLTRLHECFDLSSCREFTVEAGRPDTITDEKLLVLRRFGVDRVSVNPQTMSDSVLEAIGRKHTAADVYTALERVRRVGGFAVNMDLIAGLPEDSPEGFSDTLTKVLSLSPENITVHTLSLKKGSRIMLEGTSIPTDTQVGAMLDEAAARLTKAEYEPYYLYRQKFMSGGFENVGWCRKGYSSLYNICIMEELCSIVAMGAGASTKLVTGTGCVKRYFAPKYPQEYIEGIEKICVEKIKIKEFYDELSVK